jgi:hypothetical protein
MCRNDEGFDGSTPAAAINSDSPTRVSFARILVALVHARVWTPQRKGSPPGAVLWMLLAQRTAALFG